MKTLATLAFALTAGFVLLKLGVPMELAGFGCTLCCFPLLK